MLTGVILFSVSSVYDCQKGNTLEWELFAYKGFYVLHIYIALLANVSFMV